MKVGCRVQKINGSNSGETGVVEAIEETIGGKVKIKVMADDSTLQWKAQDSGNFKIVSSPKKMKVAKVKNEKEKDGNVRQTIAKVDDDLRQTLDAYRQRQAETLSKTESTIFTDTQLNDIVELCPDTLTALQSVKGFGSKKVSLYGEGIVLCCRHYQQMNKKEKSRKLNEHKRMENMEKKEKESSVKAGDSRKGRVKHNDDKNATTQEVSAGCKVQKINGANSGETGVVETVDEVNGKLKIKVIADNTTLQWKTQDADNFKVLNSPKNKVVDNTEKAVQKDTMKKANFIKRKEANSIKAGDSPKGGIKHNFDQAADDKNATTQVVSVGCKVQKINGANSGETGVVETVDEVNGKLKIKVIADNTTLQWKAQDADNFKVLNSPKNKGVGKKAGKAVLEEDNLVNDMKSLNLNQRPELEKWNESKDVSFPPEFTRRSLVEMPMYVAENKITWNDHAFTSTEWQAQLDTWNRKYPNISVKKGNSTHTTHESSTFRSSQTTSNEMIAFCWDSLRHTHPCIPSKFSDKFRVDMYGNVVSIDSSDGALCKFDVDHIFPWCRGGRSARNNFVACQWDANRRVKSDTLLQALSARDMACGLSPEQFSALLKYAEIKGKTNGGGRRDVSHFRDRAIHWLIQGPRKGFALSNFRELVKNTEDGATLWSFFESHELAQLTGKDMPKFAVHGGGGAPLPSVPSVDMRQTSTCLECFGPQTFQIRDTLRSLGTMLIPMNTHLSYKTCC